MRAIVRLGAVSLVLASLLGAWWARTAGSADGSAVRANVLVSGGTPDQVELVRWAVGRFEAAELQPPAVEIEFHASPSGCGGHLGFARSGEVDVCTTLVNVMARRTLLHEMSHIWLDQHVDDATEARFLAFRDLPSWNASDDPWRLRGCEQGAEIVSWALGERILTAQIPDNEEPELARGFELLTGSELPEPRLEAVATSIRSKGIRR